MVPSGSTQAVSGISPRKEDKAAQKAGDRIRHACLLQRSSPSFFPPWNAPEPPSPPPTTGTCRASQSCCSMCLCSFVAAAYQCTLVAQLLGHHIRPCAIETLVPVAHGHDRIKACVPFGSDLYCMFIIIASIRAPND